MNTKVFILLLCASYTVSSTINKLEFFTKFLELLEECVKEGVVGATEGVGRCMLGFKDESLCKYDELKVNVNLFTNTYEKLIWDRTECPDSNLPVKIIIHGWHSAASNEWVKRMTEAYLRRGDYNVITVDWSEPASKCFYFSSAANTQCIGYLIGNMILRELAKCNISPRNIHIIGHSLGAHVAGFAGKYVAKYDQKVSRITGLDAAGPCFEDSIFDIDRDNRLYKGDADIVDVYHTTNTLGSDKAVADYDFIINGGMIQPGCTDNVDNIFQYIYEGLHCSHGRAVEYFTESILSDKFIATKCKHGIFKDWKYTKPIINERMGEDLIATKPHGLYCIDTNAQPPYAMDY